MYSFRASILQDKWYVETNLKRYVTKQDFTYYYAESINAKDDIIELAKKNKGVGIRETADCIEVYNDPYCTIPLYIWNTQSGVYITSVFEEIETNNMQIDNIGFYETLLFESALYDRTLYQEIKQLPSASLVKINKSDLSYTIENYWNFNICEDKEIKSEEQAINLVWDKLCDIFAGYRNRKLIMGVSGGLDSRLSLCAMDSVLNMQDVEAFTFGHSRGILDYKLACKVCEKLSAPIVPKFYKLPGEAYLDSMDLPLKTGGGVGINHSHIYWCLEQMDTQGKTLVSNYYSDAIMGYDCVPIQYEDTVENCAYYRKLYSNKLQLSEELMREIEADLRKITDRRVQGSNFSCYDEFIYLVERNPKFHIKLSYAFCEKISVVLPYAEYSLLETMLSLPLEYRYRKRIEHLVLQKRMGVVRDISSTRYAGIDKEEKTFWSKCYYNLGFFLMRVMNLCNSGLNVITGGNVQMPNPYITENQLAIFNKYFIGHHEAACRGLYDKKLISEALFKSWNIKPKRTAEAQFYFGVVGIWSVINTNT